MNTQKPVLQTTTAFYYRVKNCNWEFELLDWEDSDGKLSKNTQSALNKTRDYFESFYSELDLYDKNRRCVCND